MSLLAEVEKNVGKHFLFMVYGSLFMVRFRLNSKPAIEPPA
jgi:hypothetical protein